MAYGRHTVSPLTRRANRAIPLPVARRAGRASPARPAAVTENPDLRPLKTVELKRRTSARAVAASIWIPRLIGLAVLLTIFVFILKS